jgi:acetyl-CoA carboxylase alpha subunit
VINELSDKVVIVDSKIEEVEEFIENKNNIISNTITNALLYTESSISSTYPTKLTQQRIEQFSVDALRIRHRTTKE